MAEQMMPQDPAAEFLVGGQHQPTQKFTFMGQEFASQQEAEAAIASWIRQTEQEKAELRGAVQAQPSAPAAPPQQSSPRQWDNDAYFKALANDPLKAQDMLDRYRMGLDPNAAVSPMEVLRNTVATTMAMQATLQDLTLRTNHPEIDWSNPQVRKAVDEAARQYGNIEGGIAVLQRDGKLPTRQSYEAWRSQQMGQQPQYQQAPQNTGAVNSFWSQGSTNVVPMPAPPTMNRTGAPAAPAYDFDALRAEADRLAALPPSPEIDAKFDRITNIIAAEEQRMRQARVG